MSVGLVGRKNLFGGVWFSQDVELATETLLSEATTDPISHLAALLFFHNLTQRNRPIPRQLQIYIAGVVSMSLHPPKLFGKYTNAQDARDREIAQLINNIILQTGLPATSSNVDEGKSACHAVARALTVLRLQPSSYEAIRRIWRSRKTLLIVELPRRV